MSGLHHRLRAAGASGSGAPIEFVSSSINRVNATTNTVAAPSSIQQGDLLVMVGSNVSSGRSINSVPSGWTEHLNDASVDLTAHVYTKVATSSEPANYTWGFAGSGNPNTIAILCYRNASSVDVVGARTRVESATAIAASVTATIEGALIAVYSVDKTGLSISTPPSGMTQRVLQLGSEPSFTAYDLIPSSSGASGDKTLVWDNSDTVLGWLFQIY